MKVLIIAYGADLTQATREAQDVLNILQAGGCNVHLLANQDVTQDCLDEVLAHGPFTSLYGHLSAINVGCGQYVSAGQFIGAVGNTGNSSGPHLHFELRYNDVPFDPTSTMPF